jgi:hypothetical protein
MVEASRPYVRVRVTDMRGIDLNVYRFNYDLTFAALLMHGDGTIYHTYAGRDASDASSHQSEASFVAALKAGVKAHIAHEPRARAAAAPRTVESLPRWKRELAGGRKIDCFHCHQVAEGDGPAETPAARRRLLASWPDPVQAGLTFDRDDQTTVRTVAEGSPAARVDLRQGDRLTALDRAPVVTFGDVQSALDRAGDGPARLRLRFERDGAERDAVLALPARWKEPEPYTFRWRPSVWMLGPRPGFGGPALSAAQKRAAGLSEDAFAMRVNYLVTWGDQADSGRRAQQAGLKKGHVVVAVAGKRDFADPPHFHAWFRFTRKPGERVPIEVIDGDEKRTLYLELSG